MNVLLSWMREFVPQGFGELENDPNALADVLTGLGLVVESVETVGANWDGIVVAKVLGLRKHPEADRIQLVDVDTGGAASAAGEPLQICCGAFNMTVGDLVPLATIGTTMPGGMEIAERQLRGETSNGMLCSAVELEAGDDSDGIMILDAGLTIGQGLSEALGRESDVLFELDVEGNRPDALSVAGVARDLAAKLGTPFVLPETPFAETEPPASSRASVVIEDSVLCQRFGLRVLDNVTVGQSPLWMQQRLIASGQRPINAVVDISNYVMLERGQPNHTFDLATVPDGALRVRMATEGETITTLDGQERTLSATDGLVCNGDSVAISIAGVMGGFDTEISESTTSVLLEAAVWDRMTIAKTSRRLGLRSEASTRFERGADPQGIERALDRFCQLAAEICGATIAEGALVVDGGVSTPPQVTVRTARVNQILNLDLDVDQVAKLLTPIGFATVSVATDSLVVQIPSWRPDSSAEIDVIEEIGRHHGYEKSGSRVPTPAQAGVLTATQLGRRKVRSAFMAEGFSEAMPLPFLAPGDLAKAGLDEAGISLENPLVAEESILRTSLLPGLLKAVAFNQSHRNADVRLFELGAVFLPSDDELPVEEEWVAAVVMGADAAVAVETLHQVARTLNLAGMRIINSEIAGLHPTRSAELQFWGKSLGSVGEISPEVLEAYEIEGRVAWLAMRVPPIVKAQQSPPKFKKVSRYPSSDLDLAFVVPASVAASDVINTMRKAGGELLKTAELFDVFRSETIGGDARSLAYRLRFQAADRTLTDDELAGVREKIIGAVTKKHTATLR